MPLSKIKEALSEELGALEERGSLKGKETVVIGVKEAEKGKGPRYLIEGYGDKEFMRMNSNSYLGMTSKKEVIVAEEEAARKFGTGPGAVRFISGTYKPHVELEKKLANFHNREAGMIFSSAYAAVMGVLTPLISKDSIVISDELNHNSIINAVRLARPRDKKIYKHLDMSELESNIKECVGNCRRVIIVTDGIFSMRGDHAPLPDIANLAEEYDLQFEEGILTAVDDSHGVGAVAETGRGTTELTCDNRVDILIGTLGKAMGVNGGYLVSDATVIKYLRETAPFYIYSNSITVSEACAALKVLEILDSEEGTRMLEHLKEMATYFRNELLESGYEIIKGEHPIVPIMVRDTGKTIKLVKYLQDNGILATGLYYPVVPKGDEEIRFQVCADHTKSDLDYALSILKKLKE